MVCRVTKIEQRQVDLEEKQEAFDKRLNELEFVGIENKGKEAITEQKERHYENLPMQKTEIFLALKIENFQLNFFYIFLIFAQNIDCGYTLGPVLEQK